jgi:hypothetical protein
MTDYKISALTTGSPVAADLFPFVKVIDTTTPPAGPGGSDQKVTAADLAGVLAVLSGSVTQLSPSGDTTGATDTGAIQAALLSFGTLAGWSAGLAGVVLLGPGQFFISNTLVVPPGVHLVGAGWGATQILLVTGSNCDMIQWASYQSSTQAAILGVSASAIGNAFWAGTRYLNLHGDAFHTTVAGYHHGINVTSNPLLTTAPSDPDFDLMPTIENVWIEACTGDGYFHAGRSGAFLKRVWSSYNNGVGFTPSFDTTMQGCLSEGNGAGIYLNHSSNLGSGVKVYNNLDLTWVSGTSYAPASGSQTSVCVSAGVMYFCIAAVSGTTPPASDPTHWTALTGATAPQATGNDWYFDTGAGAHCWTGVESQQPSRNSFYFKGPNAGTITVDGQSENVNFNNGQPGYSATNPNHYAAVVLDGVSGVKVTLNSSTQGGGGSGNGIICTSLNSPGANDLTATTDGTETALFNGGTPTYARVNGVLQSVLATAAGTDTSGVAAVTNPSLTSGTAAQLSTTHDTMFYILVTTTSTVALTFGSTSSATTTLVTSGSRTAPLTLGGFRIPKGWFVKATFTSADVTLIAVPC